MTDAPGTIWTICRHIEWCCLNGYSTYLLWRNSHVGYQSLLDINYFYNMASADLNTVSFNIYGFKSSYPTVDLLLEEGADIVIYMWALAKTCRNFYYKKSRYKDFNCWTHVECSTDCDHISAGRPYGGHGWICKRIKSVPYKVIECDSGRIRGLHVTQNPIEF